LGIYNIAGEMTAMGIGRCLRNIGNRWEYLPPGAVYAGEYIRQKLAVASISTIISE
jgi:hypothetical protein